VSGGGGERLTVRVYRGTPVAGRFLDKYEEILATASKHAAGAFMRDCLMRGFAAMEADGPPPAPRVVYAIERTEVGNTQQNNNELVSDNDSDNCVHGLDAEAEVIKPDGAAETGDGVAGSGVRGMVSRLGLGAVHMGKADEKST